MLQTLRKIRSRTQSQKGFTLVELLIVVAILGILAGIVTLSLVGLTGTAQKQSCIQEKSTLQSALDAYMANFNLSTITTPGGATTSPGSVSLSANGTLVAAGPGGTTTFLRSATTQFSWNWNASGSVSGAAGQICT
jgi:prepilin-type N-terminal cleavage/methylation domain-containing protein